MRLRRTRRNQRLAGADACTGCGTCYAVCPTNAIQLEVDRRRGVYYPRINIDRCSSCGVCSEVCPGLSLDIDSIASLTLDARFNDSVVGDFERCYIAHATDHNIRYSSASGGLVTTLLIMALEEGLIDGALVTRMDRGNPLLPEPFIARTKEDILSASSSKYCPVPANKAIRTLLENEGRFAVVGLPCHLHGIRKAEMVNEDLRRKIALHLGLFCSHTLSFHGTQHLLSRIGLNPTEVVGMRYRGQGWPGGLTIQMKGGRDRFIANQDPLWGMIFGSHFFTPSSCLWCTDLTSELSDVSFGDPWLPGILKDERIGKSVVVSRTQRGEDLLRIARERKRIEAGFIDSRVVVASQSMFSHFKKGSVRVRQRFGGRPQIASPTGMERIENPISAFVAFMTILNSSMGCNRLFRIILERTPSGLLHLYSAVFNAVLAREERKWIE